MSKWKTLSSEMVYETKWIKVFKDEVLNQNGTPLTYSYMETQNSSVFVVAMDDHDKVLIQQVYRYTLNDRIWEFPAGFFEKDETPIAAGKRELLEESGFISDNWQDLGYIYQIIGTGRVRCAVVLARNVRKSGEATDKEEDIDNHQFRSFEELEDMVNNQELIDSPVIAALYKAKVHILKEEK